VGQRTELVCEPFNVSGWRRKHHAVPGLDEERAKCASLSPGADGADAERGPPPAASFIASRQFRPTAIFIDHLAGIRFLKDAIHEIQLQ
jgi:hypothetical protein